MSTCNSVRTHDNNLNLLVFFISFFVFMGSFKIFNIKCYKTGKYSSSSYERSYSKGCKKNHLCAYYIKSHSIKLQ